MPNKVRYGLRNVHYAVMNQGGTYAAPVRIPGAVNMTLSPVGEKTPFVADDIDYYTSVGNNGYDGEIEFALIPQHFAVAALGDTLDENGVQFENANAQPVPFALLFEFTGDSSGIKHVLYNCNATRPNIDGTATTNKEVKTETLGLTARPNASGRVKGKSTDTTDADAIANWYNEVYEYVPVVSGG